MIATGPHGIDQLELFSDCTRCQKYTFPLEAQYAGAHGFLAWCHEILFVHGGFSDENRSAAIRHARAAVSYGRDDATALAFGAFVIAMVEHDRATAVEAFEQALALSPSSSLALFVPLWLLLLRPIGERRGVSLKFTHEIYSGWLPLHRACAVAPSNLSTGSASRVDGRFAFITSS